MSRIELQNKIIKKLESVDTDLLKEVMTLIEFETQEGQFTLSSAQKSAIDEARQQVKDGLVVSNEDVDKEIDSWLNE